MKAHKENAEELVDKIITVQRGFFMPHQIAVECAKIAVDEIINSPSMCEWENEDDIDFGDYFDYWEGVKNELNKM